MKTTKAYLAGLGMAGIVIGSILVLLAVGTGVVAFDALPDFSSPRDPLDRVVAEKDAPARGGGGRARKAQGAGALVIAPADRYPVRPRPLVAEPKHGPARRAHGRRHRTRTDAARGFGGAESWTGARLGGGAALGTGETRGGGGDDAPVGAGRPSGEGTLLAPVIESVGGGVPGTLDGIAPIDPLPRARRQRPRG